MTQLYQVRPATQDELPAILDLIGSAAQWLQKDKNTAQWAKPWPDEEGRDARIVQGIGDGLIWTATASDGMPVATITCRGHGNDLLWTPQEQAEPAAYVSRLIVSRDLAGQGLGASLIDWAGLHGVRQWRADWIRIDVWTTNTGLHNYYKRHGFEYVRTRELQHEWDYPSAVLFQEPAAAIDTSAAARFEMAESKQRLPAVKATG